MAVPAAEIGAADAPGDSEGEARRDQRDQGAGKIEKGEAAHPQHRQAADAGADLGRNGHVEGGEQEAEDRQHRHQGPFSRQPHPRRPASVQQLRQGVGVDQCPRQRAPVLAVRRGKRRAVTVAVGQIGTDDHDLAGQPRLREEPDRVGRKDAEGRCPGVGPLAVGERNPGLGNRGAEDRGQRSGQPPDHAVSAAPAGEDPAHGAVAGVRLQIGQALFQALEIVLEKGRLPFGELVVAVGPGDHHRHAEGLEDGAQFGVLGLLRGLVEKDVETDGAHAGGLQCAQETGQETAVQGRAVGQRR